MEPEEYYFGSGSVASDVPKLPTFVQSAPETLPHMPRPQCRHAVECLTIH